MLPPHSVNNSLFIFLILDVPFAGKRVSKYYKTIRSKNNLASKSETSVLYFQTLMKTSVNRKDL